METKTEIKDENCEVTNMCRVCMDVGQGEFISVFDEVKNDTIAFMISDCAGIEISETDDLPKKCCERCIEGVYIAYCIRKQCRESDMRLRSIFATDIDQTVKKETLEILNFETVTVENNFYPETPAPCPEVREEENKDDNDGEDFVYYEDSDSDASDSEDEEKDDKNEAKPNEDEGEDQEKEEITSDDEVDANEEVDDDDDEDYNPGMEEGSADLGNNRCCSCREEYATTEEFEEHIKTMHEQQKTTDISKPYECKICYKRYLKKTSLNRHKRMSKNAMDDKAARIKISGTRCCGCKLDFESEKQLMEHSKSVHGPDRTDDKSKSYECDLCFKRYVTKTSLNRHKRKKYNNTRPRLCRKLTGNRCCGCKEKFDSNEQLIQHSQHVHFQDRTGDLSGLKPIECEICFNRYPTQDALTRHKTRIYLEKFYECSECDKSFVKRTMLRNHERKYHAGIKQKCVGTYQCVHCGKTFMQQSTLRNHEKIHLKIKPFECKDCGKGFSSKGNLQTHMRLHIDPAERKDKLYECPICLCKFKTANYLEIHARVHTGEKPYKCEFCEKLFAHTAGHKRHLLTHTGAKPHICKFCGREFANRPNMIIHEKGHLGEKNSTCDLCGKQFVHSRYMKKHRKRHFMEKNRPRAEETVMF